MPQQQRTTGLIYNEITNDTVHILLSSIDNLKDRAVKILDIHDIIENI